MTKNKPEYKFRKERNFIKKEAVTVLVAMKPQMIQQIQNQGGSVNNQNS